MFKTTPLEPKNVIYQNLPPTGGVMGSRQMTCRIPASCVLRRRNVPKRVNRIVVYEPTECITPHRNASPIGSAFGAPIRVCRGRMKGVCPPGICDCPSIPCKKPFKENLKKLAIITIKAGIVGSLIFTTCLYGVWSDAEETAKLTYEYMLWAKDFFWTRNKIARTPEEIYDMRRISYNFKNVLNNILMKNYELMAEIPEKFRELGNMIFPRTAKVQKNE